jgi:hypothetical protein
MLKKLLLAILVTVSSQAWFVCDISYELPKLSTNYDIVNFVPLVNWTCSKDKETCLTFYRPVLGIGNIKFNVTVDDERILSGKVSPKSLLAGETYRVEKDNYFVELSNCEKF